MPRLLLIGLALLLPACTYDLDKIYENDSDGADPDAPLPDPLIALWEDQDDACVSCARSECANANDTCRDDPECGKLARCAATSTDPATLDRCRSEQVPWLSANPSGRTLGGPYYSCVFRDLCADKCGTHTDLACLGGYDWSNSGVNSVTTTFQFMNALGLVNPDMLEPATDLMVKVCSGIDVDCATGSAAKSTDADGKVSLVLPTPLMRTFTGYIDVVGGDWYPTLVKLAYPVARPGVVFMPIVDKASIAANAALSGVQPDMTRGQLQIRMFGCGGIGTRGISFEASAAMIDEATRTWYASRDGFPIFESMATSDLGSGGIINVKAGFPEITARRTSDGMVVARARAPVRAGYLTIVVLAPLDASQ
jgi:hypothetical protein